MNRFVLPPKTLPPLPPDNRLISELSFLVIDTETLGTWNGSRMVELAAVKVEAAKMGDRFSRLVNPLCAIPAEVSAIHGITDDMVRKQPTADEVLPDWFSTLQDTILVAHNAEYDEGILSTEAARHNMWIPPVPILDTLSMARHLLEPQPSFRLGKLAEKLGIVQHQAHRALSDALTTAELFLYLVNLLERSGRPHFGELYRIANLSRMGTTARPLQDLPPHLFLLRAALLARSDVEIQYTRNGRTSLIPCSLLCGFHHKAADYVEVRDHRKRGHVLTLRVDFIDALKPLAI